MSEEKEEKSFGKVKLDLLHAKSYIVALEKDNESKDATIAELKQKLGSLQSELKLTFERDCQYKIGGIKSASETLLKTTVESFESKIKHLQTESGKQIAKLEEELKVRPVIEKTIEKIIKVPYRVEVRVSTWSQFRDWLSEDWR